MLLHLWCMIVIMLWLPWMVHTSSDTMHLLLQIHSPRTTVREALQFSADLRFNGYPGKAAMHAFVDEVMDLVELHPNRNSLVSCCCLQCCPHELDAASKPYTM